MNICIVSEYFYPDYFLINEIAISLTEKGHKVTILTGHPDYKSGSTPNEYSIPYPKTTIHKKIKIIRIPTIDRKRSTLRQTLSYLSFCLNASLYSFFIKEDFDIIFTYQMSPVTQIIPGYLLSKKKKIPHICYCLDIWPASVLSKSIQRNSLIYKITKKLSSICYKLPDEILVSSLPFKGYIQNLVKNKTIKMNYLPQHSSNILIEEIYKVKDDIVKLIFAGNIGEAQDIPCLLYAIQNITTTTPFHFYIYGDGSQRNHCINLAKKLNIADKVSFPGRVARDEMNKIYSRMDALILTLSPEKEVGETALTVPSKFQNYLSTGKPILAAIDGGASDIIKEIKCGLVVPAGDHQKFSIILSKYIDNRNSYHYLGQNGKAYYEKNYTKEIFIKNLLTNLHKHLPSNH